MACKNCDITFPTLSIAKSSDLEARLRCNHRASSLESAQIAELLVEVNTDYSRCDAEISRLHSMIIYLERKREQLKRRVKGFESLASPIRKVPTEVLVNIFSHCCETNDITRDMDDPEELDQALTLGMICAYWRNIMLSTPQLWSIVSLNDSFPSHSPTRQKLVELYLERSQQVPLTLSVKEMTYALEVKVIGAFVRQAHRWLNAELYLSTESSRLLAPLKNNFPILQTLGVGGDDEFVPEADVFQSLPALHTLSLSGRGPNRFTFPWAQIKHLKHENCALHRFLSVLEACPNVLSVGISRVIANDRDLDLEDLGSITREATSNLRRFSLNLHRYSWPVASALFDALMLPAMTSLYISQKYLFLMLPSTKWPADAFASFLSRSACPLTTLSLSRLPLLEPQLIAILRSLPSLTNFDFKDIPKSKSDTFTTPAATHVLIQGLDTSFASPFESWSSPLLPNLQNLSLELRGSEFTDAGFVNMVKSRWSPPGREQEAGQLASLHSVVLRVLGRPIDPNIFDTLGHLIKTGMRISVSEVNDEDIWGT